MPIDLGNIGERSRISALSLVADGTRLGHPDMRAQPLAWAVAIAEFLTAGDLSEVEPKLLMIRSFLCETDKPQECVDRAAAMIKYIATGEVGTLNLTDLPMLPLGPPSDSED